MHLFFLACRPEHGRQPRSHHQRFLAMKDLEVEEANADREQLLPGKQTSNRRMNAWLRARRRGLRRAFKRPLRLVSLTVKFILLPLVALFIAVIVFAPSYSS